MRRAVRGRDIKSGAITPGCWLRWPCDAAGAALPALPPRAAAYFRPKRDRLLRRADYRDGPAWTLFRTRAALGAHRVVWPDLARRLEAAALTGATAAFIPLNTCYLLVADDAATALVVAALLNCAWLRALAAVRAPIASGGFRRFNARVIEGLPLPNGSIGDAALVRAASDRSATGVAAVDERVADLLQLTSEERRALSDVISPPRC